MTDYDSLVQAIREMFPMKVRDLLSRAASIKARQVPPPSIPEPTLMDGAREVDIDDEQ